jgi:hypothetical protein
MIKLLMALGISRNEAADYANACGPEMPHSWMGYLITVDLKMGGTLCSLLKASAPRWRAVRPRFRVESLPGVPSQILSVRFDYE